MEFDTETSVERNLDALRSQAKLLHEVVEKRRKLGGFDTNAEDFLVLAEGTLVLMQQMIALGQRAQREVTATWKEEWPALDDGDEFRP